MNTDPLIAKESQPAETASEMLKAAERLKANMPTFTVPVLIIHGTADKATRPAGSQYFYDHAGATDKTLKLYEGHFHDLLNDVDKEKVMADIQAWLDARIPAAVGQSAWRKGRNPQSTRRVGIGPNGVALQVKVL